MFLIIVGIALATILASVLVHLNYRISDLSDYLEDMLCKQEDKLLEQSLRIESLLEDVQRVAAAWDSAQDVLRLHEDDIGDFNKKIKTFNKFITKHNKLMRKIDMHANVVDSTEIPYFKGEEEIKEIK